MYKSSLNIFFFLITMLYSLLLLLPINKWVNKKKREIKKEKKNINSGDNHQCGDGHHW